MRISDWSSDVCSSDLVEAAREAFGEGRFILKPNRGGKGLGVQPFVDADALAASVASPAFEEPRDGIHLLQEHVETEIGRASGRERVCQYVLLSVVAVA